jgi:hypothetical protein
MNIIDEIVGFFHRIFRQKINSVQSQANAKVMSAQLKAQSKVTGAINKKIDQGVQGAKEAVVNKAAPKK